MTTGASVLLLAIGLLGAGYVWRWISLERPRGVQGARPSRRLRIGDVIIGFVTLFFDTLGVGAFAPTVAIFKLQHRVEDEDIPGTMNAGHALPAVTEALIFISVVTVNFRTLITMIAAAGIGAALGVRIVARLPIRAIQLGMGIALLIAAFFVLAGNLQWMPAGSGEALGLHGAALVFSVGASFVLGALSMIGVGFFAPCLILLTLLGMSPLAAFPIMMGATAFLLPVGGAGFIKTGRYNFRTALGLTLGGIPGVLIAAFIVKSLPIVWLRWLVVFVVIYAAVQMLLSARRKPARMAAASAV